MLNFPANPNPGDTYQQYVWDGERWIVAAAAGDFLPLVGGTISGNLGVQGNTALNTLQVNGATNLNTLQAAGNSGFGANLTVAGSMGVNGATTLNNTLGVIGNSTLGGTVDVAGNATFGGTGNFAGLVSVFGPPTGNLHATNKAYVDEAIAASVLWQGIWNADSNTPNLATATTANGYSWTVLTAAEPHVVPAIPAIPGLSGMDVFNGDTVIWSNSSAQFEIVRGSTLSLAEAQGLFLQLTGGSLAGPGNLNVGGNLAITGTTTLAANAATNLQAVPLQQLNSVAADKLDRMATVRPTGTDLNLLFEQGRFSITNAVNRPPAIVDNGIYSVTAWTPTTPAGGGWQQEAFGYDTGGNPLRFWRRSSTATTWTAWVQIATRDWAMGITNLIPNNADLDDYFAPGFYGVNSHAPGNTILNRPVTNSGAFALTVVNMGDNSGGSGRYQIFYSSSGSLSNSPRIFVRGGYGPWPPGTWGGWVELARHDATTGWIANTVPRSAIPTNGYATYGQAVLLLCNWYEGTLIAGSWISGKFIFRRGSAGDQHRFWVCDIHVNIGYNANSYDATVDGASFQNMSQADLGSFALCEYDGLKWLCLSLPYNTYQFATYNFDGFYSIGFPHSNSRAMQIIPYRNTQTGVVLNQEVFDSLEILRPITRVASRGWAGLDPITLATGADLNTIGNRGIWQTTGHAVSSALLNRPPNWVQFGVGTLWCTGASREQDPAGFSSQLMLINGSGPGYNQDRAWFRHRDSPTGNWRPWGEFTIGGMPPFMWLTNGTEMELGNGSFGRRFAGTLTMATAGNLLQTTLTSALTTGNCRLVESGGWWDTGGNHAQLGHYLSLSPVLWWSAIYTQPTSLILNTLSSTARTNAAYDVWVRYTKV